MRTLTLALYLFAVFATTAAGQSRSALEEAIVLADTTPTVENLLGGTNAAILLRNFTLADSLHDRAGQQLFQLIQGATFLGVWKALSSGEGVDGALREFHTARSYVSFPPVMVASLVGNFPELLTGGALDDEILALRADASDPEERCTCYSEKAWVHRMAGREEVARVYWDSLVANRGDDFLASQPTADARAHVAGQHARDLARAGRTGEARRALAQAMEMEVSSAGRPLVVRRWAQAYAELGDTERVVELLESLLGDPSPITVHSLEVRAAWAGVRHTEAFQAMLARHR